MLIELGVYVGMFIGMFAAVFFVLTFLEEEPASRPVKMAKFPRVTIVVPAWNAADTIANTIKSLLNINYPKGRLEIIVVENNNSNDGTLKIARAFEKDGVIVYSIKEGGKGRAVNFALKKATGDIFGAIDSDSYATPNVLLNMLPYFSDSEVVAVTPALKVYKPKNIWEHVQSLEYIYGIFLRKVFAFLGSIHVAPGPMTIYRLDYFRKTGGFDEDNITEDMEVALRIQSQHLKIENAPDGVVYTSSPQGFSQLMRQRLRWYLGFFENIIKYRRLMASEHGLLGVFILPLALYSIGFSIAMFAYSAKRILADVIRNVLNFHASNFDFLAGIKSSLSLLPFYSPGVVSALAICFLIFGAIMLYFGWSRSGREEKLYLPYFLYVFFYTWLFALWWLAAIYAKLFARELKFGGVVWKNSIINQILHRQ
ncbi:MAG: glycosyltransferase family 2 protein [DPANN group archaeon]|nr:glycosyltransferase family 2 protein [DPANN group archaeon]